jgi:hypothetical protein
LEQNCGGFNFHAKKFGLEVSSDLTHHDRIYTLEFNDIVRLTKVPSVYEIKRTLRRALLREEEETQNQTFDKHLLFPDLFLFKHDSYAP